MTRRVFIPAIVGPGPAAPARALAEGERVGGDARLKAEGEHVALDAREVDHPV